jgi:NAD(P)-dependent dehydrogenase (short-subunit alcohol dehydrogenase family)
VIPDSKVVVVTGSAGGIGRAITAKLEHHGHRVVGLDRSGCRPDSHDRQIDMADTDALLSVAHELAGGYEIRALVHNAAVQPMGAVGETSVADWIEALRVNVLAADVLAGAFQRSLAAQSGAVVVVSSVHARATTGGITAYATTKAALEGWVRSAALDLGPHVRVNAIAPGAVDTAKLREGFDRWGPDLADERREVLRERTALGRIADPCEIAEVVDFLLGPQSAFMTGSILTIDGGASARLGSE